MNPNEKQCPFNPKHEIRDFQFNLASDSMEFYSMNCKVCGSIFLKLGGVHRIKLEAMSKEDKWKISVHIRKQWEMKDREQFDEALTYADLERIIFNHRSLDALEKMDEGLLNIDRGIKHIGGTASIDTKVDYPYYHCISGSELSGLIALLKEENLISGTSTLGGSQQFILTSAGYRKLRELKSERADSRQCFVAMWFADELKDAFEIAIKPAIEFVETDQIEPRFKAVRIDNVEHTNDINDEIIAQIRRSKFMVCDLTGYRGGVYFEAGFAYGLGLPVIYTCRKDWTEAETLKDEKENEVKVLFDSNGNEVQIRKEGVHFDLAHRNRIQWDPDDFDGFRTKLENRIKAVIV